MGSTRSVWEPLSAIFDVKKKKISQWEHQNSPCPRVSQTLMALLGIKTRFVRVFVLSQLFLFHKACRRKKVHKRN